MHFSISMTFHVEINSTMYPAIPLATVARGSYLAKSESTYQSRYQPNDEFGQQYCCQPSFQSDHRSNKQPNYLTFDQPSSPTIWSSIKQAAQLSGLRSDCRSKFRRSCLRSDYQSIWQSIQFSIQFSIWWSIFTINPSIGSSVHLEYWPSIWPICLACHYPDILFCSDEYDNSNLTNVL